MLSMDPQLNTLRGKVKYKFLNEIMPEIHKASKNPNVFYTMVTDSYSIKIFSSLFKISELASVKITMIENLELNRKSFPDGQAIYLLSPEKKSIDLLINDFENPKKPKYGSVHLLFLNNVKQELFKEMAKKENLSPRVLSFKEINLNFSFFDENSFTLCMPYNYDFIVKNLVDPNIVSEICYKLLSLCSTISEDPVIRYNSNSKYCSAIAKSFVPLIASYKEKNNSFFPRNPRCHLLLIDRSFDIWSPLQHSFSVISLMADCLKVNNNFEINYQQNSKEGEPEEKAFNMLGLNSKFGKYKYMHAREFELKVHSHAEKVKKAQSKENSGKLAERVREIKKLIDESVGINEIHHVFLMCKNPMNQRGYLGLIDLEQQIISGMTNNCNDAVDNSKIVQTISKLNSEFPNLTENDKVRIIGIFFSIYDLSTKIKQSIEIKLSTEESKTTLKKIELLDPRKGNSAKGTIERKVSKIDSNHIDLFKERQKNVSGYSLTYGVPLVAQIILDLMNGNLSEKDFPYASPATKEDKLSVVSKKTFKLTKGKKEEYLDDKPTIILFMIGGFSIQEINYFEDLKKYNQITANIIYGGTNILTADKFIQSINGIQFSN